MPVDQAWLLDMVLDPNAKRPVDVGCDPKGSVGLADAKYGSGLAVHLYVTALELQYRWRPSSVSAHSRDAVPREIVPARKLRRDSTKVSPEASFLKPLESRKVAIEITIDESATPAAQTQLSMLKIRQGDRVRKQSNVGTSRPACAEQ